MASIGTLNLDFKTNVATLINDMRRASNAVSSSSRQMEKSIRGLQTAFRGLIALFATRQLVRISDEFTTLNNKLKLVSNSPVELQRALQGVADVSQRTLSSISATATLYSRLSVATKDLGLSQGELLKVTEAVNNTFRISGSTTQEAAAAAIQLAQGLASGALKGDELRSVLENNTRLGRLLAEALDTNVGALRDMAAEGQLTADVVAGALLKNFQALRDEASKIAPTFESAFTVVREQFELGYASQTAEQFAGLSTSIAESGDNARKFGVVIGSLVKDFTGFFNEIGKVIAAISDMVNGMQTFAYVTKTAMNGVSAAILLVQKAVLILTEKIVTAFDELNKLSRSAARFAGFNVSALTGNEKILADLRAGIKAVDIETVKLGRDQVELHKNYMSGNVFDSFTTDAQKATAALTALGKGNTKNLGLISGKGGGAPDEPPKPKKGPRGESPGIKEARQQAEAIKDVIENLKFENEQLGRNAQQQELYAALRQAGVAADSQAGQAIAALVGEHQRLEAAQKAGADLQEELVKRGQQAIEQHKKAFEGFNSVVEQGLRGQIKSWKDLGQAILAEIQNIVVAQYQMQASNGSSGIGGLLGSIFGLGSPKLSQGAIDLALFGSGQLFARGGISNRPAIFGEAGPEAAVPLPDGRRIPVDLRGSASGGTYYIDARGADAAGLARVEAQIRALNGSVERRALSAVRSENARNPKFLR